MPQQLDSISLDELRSLVANELSDCSAAQRAFFHSCACEPEKWTVSPCGDNIGGFWALGTRKDHVLWYNEFEEGFNVSRFEQWGAIPPDEFWCNDDPLVFALHALASATGGLSATTEPTESWWPEHPRPATCSCSAMPESFYIDDAPRAWLRWLDEVASSEDREVRRCPICGCLFAVQGPPASFGRAAFKLPTIEVGDDVRFIEEQGKRLLIRNHGGIDPSTPCIWAGCEEPRVGNIAYCAEHLWADGIRR